MKPLPLKIGALLLAATLGLSTARAESAAPLDLLLATLAKVDNAEVQANILRGANASLKGRRGLPVPAQWDALYAKLQSSPNAEVRQQAQALAVTFGGASAIAEMRRVTMDAKADLEVRKTALDSLISAKDAAALPLLLELIKQPGALRTPALRGLASYQDTQIPAALLGVYPQLGDAEKRDAINALISRAEGARALLAAIDTKQLARTEITAPLARQLQNINDPQIEQWMAKNWGVVRTSSAEKQAMMAKFKTFLGTDAILRSDAARGRTLYAQICGACHTLFGEGGKIGPELPGGFEDVDYLLHNVIDPNALVGKDYQQTFITTKSGQLVAGIIVSEDDREVVLKTLADPVTVRRADIAELKTSDLSMMPEGLLAALDEQGVRDLFLYLRQKKQVPLPAAK